MKLFLYFNLFFVSCFSFIYAETPIRTEDGKIKFAIALVDGVTVFTQLEKDNLILSKTLVNFATNPVQGPTVISLTPTTIEQKIADELNTEKRVKSASEAGDLIRNGISGSVISFSTVNVFWLNVSTLAGKSPINILGSVILNDSFETKKSLIAETMIVSSQTLISSIVSKSPLSIIADNHLYEFKTVGTTPTFLLPQNSDINSAISGSTQVVRVITVSTFGITLSGDVKLPKMLEVEEIAVLSGGFKSKGRVWSLLNDVEISSSTKGLILKSNNQSKWLVWVGDNGLLSTTLIAASPEISDEERARRRNIKEIEIKQAFEKRNALDLKSRLEYIEAVLGIK